MTKRILTGVALLALLAFALYFGGWVFSVLWVACVCIAMYEMFHALSNSGHNVVAWPTWASLLLAIPAFLLLTQVQPLLLLVMLVSLVLFITMCLVMFRDEPKLMDLMVSVLPLFSIALPGMSLLGMTNISTVGYQRVLLTLAFLIPVLGDSMAFFIGSKFGKHKLIPAISPNKTKEGAVAGLFGSILAAVLVYLVALPFKVVMPAFIHFIVLGILGGIAGQIGDLFASFVKRHCDLKDFGHIFPGHGGMMDRLDSVLFSGTLVFLYQALLRT